jgi:hypothetical protein
MSDLLKESIADAKAVRETALANAKLFLEENFAKSMKEMFAEKLKEEMAEDGQQEATETEGTVEETLKSSGIGGEKGNVAGKQHPVKPSASANKNTTPAGKQEFDATLEEAEKVEKEGDEEITSEELDEILAELEGSVTSEAKEDEEKSEEEDDDDDVKKESAELSEEEDEEVSLDEILAELENEEAAAAPAAPAPEVEPAPAPVAHTPAAVEPAPAPAPAPEPTAEVSHDVSAEEMAEAILALNEENEKLKGSLSEHVKTVKYLRGILEETNLLNAKLLYTNKLFKGKNLSEDQKMKVINTFDLTKNIREVKLAYTVLAESFNVGGSVAKKKTNATVTSITEGLASKPVSSTKPADVIVESTGNEMASRFQKLAGIKK